LLPYQGDARAYDYQSPRYLTLTSYSCLDLGSFHLKVNMFTRWKTWPARGSSYRELQKRDFEAARDGEIDSESLSGSNHHPQLSFQLPAEARRIYFPTVVARIGSQRYQPSREPSASPANTSYCGNSTQEALSLGCTFDQLTWSWFPPSCPHYANDEYLAAENWTFFLDNQHRFALPKTDPRWIEALDNKIELWGEQREHTAHCVFLFLALAQIVKEKGPHASYYRNYAHMEHCAGLILDVLKSEPDRERIATFAGSVSYDQQCMYM